MEIEKSFQVFDVPKAVCYYQQICGSNGAQSFVAPWGGCILKNCNETGEILDFKTIKEYEEYFKNTKRQFWLYLPMKVFRNDSELFAVFCCPECESMAGMLGLQIQQSPSLIGPKLCHHSRVASSFIKDWRDIWNIEPSPSDQMFSVCENNDRTCDILIPNNSTESFLAAVFHNLKISLLFCVTPRQDIPFCTNCVRRKCIHFTIVKNQVVLPQALQAELEEVEFDPNEEETDLGYDDNYLKLLPNHIRGQLYGYNFHPITYPFRDSQAQQDIWIERMKGTVNIPGTIVPLFDINLKCKHNCQYNSADNCLVQESSTLCLFTELGDRIFPTSVYARPTSGSCTCLQRYDGHSDLIWNLGKGKFVDYTLLHGYLHRWRTSGMSMQAQYRSIVDGAESAGMSCSLTYTDIHRSVCGFFSNLEFNLEIAFTCPSHGSSPKFIVADGKSVGPLKRRVKHLCELDVAEEDSKVLSQSTYFKTRIFITEKKERDFVCKLVTKEVTMEDFVQGKEIKSDNGKMLINLVKHILETFPEKIPHQYISLLTNVSKNSSARSLLQTNTIEPLKLLQSFCLEDLDLRIVENNLQLQTISSSLPALWPILEEICLLEKTKFLPKEVSEIIIKLLTLRNETFSNAATRSNSDYFLWNNPVKEHPTMCYPMLPLWRHPSKYEVSKQVDSDLCDKTFTYHDDFCAGIFSVGCGCENNITLGFEIMFAKESPRNLFRFLMTRDVDMDSLEGIIVDFACNFEPYVLNREAGMLEKVLVLVDGAHWTGRVH